MLAKLIDYGFRKAYRVAWPFVRRCRRFRQCDGACVAVWANDRVLVVRHSYKAGLSIPGGGLKSNEDSRVGAVRELREEVGIDVKPAALRLTYVKRYASGTTNYFFEVHLPVEPQITIDRREIIYAEFLSASDILLSGCDHYFAAYLTNTDECLLQSAAE
jgi:8-oxo-dGTP pyrophosphatase MutT (NUDIX family)